MLTDCPFLVHYFIPYAFALASRVFTNRLNTTMAHYTQTDFLERYRWKNRLVLLFASSYEDSLLKSQLAEIKLAQAGYKEREIRVVTCATDSPVVDALKEHFQIDSDQFMFLLIGKDGSEKMRSNHVIDSAAFFELIDSMPMRRWEMDGGVG